MAAPDKIGKYNAPGEKPIKSANGRMAMKELLPDTADDSTENNLWSPSRLDIYLLMEA